MRTVTIALLLLLPAQAWADELADNAKQCWSLLPQQFALDPSVEMQVEIKSGLLQSVEVQSYSPDTAEGFAIAESAAKSVAGCGPYDVEDGSHNFTMDTKVKASPSISIPAPGQQ